MKEILLLNPEGANEVELSAYTKREAARAIVQDAEGKVALLHVSNDGYYKLPGGGIEEGEDRLVALARECEEEIGCAIEVQGEVGIVIEWRKFQSLFHTSYCYAARVKGEKGVPHFTDSEIDHGFQIVWVTYDEAVRLMTEGAQTATTKQGKDYIVPRDTAFLKAARELV